MGDLDRGDKRAIWEKAREHSTANAVEHLEKEVEDDTPDLGFISKDDLIAAFRHFDISKDGMLTKEEFRHAMVNLGHLPITDAAFSSMFKVSDKDGNGVVNYTEFVSWLSGASDYQPDDDPTEGTLMISDDDIAFAARTAK